MFRKRPQIPHLPPNPYSHTHSIPEDGRRSVGAANDVLNGTDSGQSLPTSFDRISAARVENMRHIWSHRYSNPVLFLVTRTQIRIPVWHLKGGNNDKRALQVYIRDLIGFGLSGLQALPDCQAWARVCVFCHVGEFAGAGGTKRESEGDSVWVIQLAVCYCECLYLFA